MRKNSNGVIVISLDFELLWGVFDKVDWKEKIEYFQNTKNTIPKILNLFEKYKIACTWATVGMLFNENWDEWNSNIPEFLPDYSRKELSAYEYGKFIQSKESETICFAPELIRLINNTPYQEIGTHTYSHYYCLEDGQELKAFEYDLKKAIELAHKFDNKIESLVFPRNQFNQEYLSLCKDLGIKTVRSNPQSWYWQNTQKDSLQHKIFRTGDAYLGRNNKSYPINKIKSVENMPDCQMASRLLRPYSERKIAEKLKIKRIKSEITKAAKQGEVYHLWWHPHNFGVQPLKSLEQLEIILKHYEFCKNNYNFQSKTMAELTT